MKIKNLFFSILFEGIIVLLTNKGANLIVVKKHKGLRAYLNNLTRLCINQEI